MLILKKTRDILTKFIYFVNRFGSYPIKWGWRELRQAVLMSCLKCIECVTVKYVPN